MLNYEDVNSQRTDTLHASMHNYSKKTLCCCGAQTNANAIRFFFSCSLYTSRIISNVPASAHDAIKYKILVNEICAETIR
jgi:hypothetical protein